jgi:hypothetical protein
MLDLRQVPLASTRRANTLSRLIPSGDRQQARHFESLVARRLPVASTLNLVGSMEPIPLSHLSADGASRTYAVSVARST